MTYDNGNVLCEGNCGNRIIENQACDLGRGNEEYGCSDNCEVEEHFTCETQNGSSTCFFSGTF